MIRLRAFQSAFFLVISIAFSACGGPMNPGVAPPAATVAAQRPLPPAARSAATLVARRRAHKASSSATDWDSFGYDLQRTGYNPNESAVGVSNVGSLQQLWTLNVGYGMIHEPVFADGVTVNSQTKNVLYAGSQNGSAMYAIDTSNGNVLWKDTVPLVGYHCATQHYNFSVGSTPAIDRGKNLLYFSDGHNDVHAVDLGTGKEAYGWPVAIARWQTPGRNFMHGGLTYNPSNGLLYAVTGSAPCDISPWYGRIVAINTTGPSIAGTFFTLSGDGTQGGSGGGIWGPGGASIDSSTNNVFVATGNADTAAGEQQNSGYAEEVVELSASLGSIIANNYPTNIPLISGDNDFDFGATPIVFQPYGCPEMVAAVNKSGMFELYDVSSISSGPVQYIAMSMPTSKGNFVGVPAWDPVTGLLYVGLPSTEGEYHAGLAAFGFTSNCILDTTPVWNQRFGPDASKIKGVQTPRSPLSIANGVIYVSNYSRKTEFAFNAATGAELWTTPLSEFGTVGTVIADGVVYVSSRDGNITAWVLPSGKSKKRNVRAVAAFAPVRETIQQYLDPYTDRGAAESAVLDNLLLLGAPPAHSASGMRSSPGK